MLRVHGGVWWLWDGRHGLADGKGEGPEALSLSERKQPVNFGGPVAAGASPGALEQLEADQLEALALKAGDDLAHQAALHAVGLDHHVWGRGIREGA